MRQVFGNTSRRIAPIVFTLAWFVLVAAPAWAFRGTAVPGS